MDPSELARVRRLVGEIADVSLDDVSPHEMQRILRDAGLPVDDPTKVVELMRRWEAMQSGLLQAALDPETEAFLVVDPVFGAAIERLGPRAADPDALAAEPPELRAIVTTRLIDGLVENGGWVSVFTERQADMLPLAIDGYRLLGLDEHAVLATRALQRGFVLRGPDDDEPDDPDEFAFWEDLEGAWFDLPSTEIARAALIRAHPDIR